MAWDENNEGGGSGNLQALDEEAKKILAKMEPDLDPVYFDQFFLMQLNRKNNKRKICINKAGLFWKLDQMYPKQYDIDPQAVTGKEYIELKQALGYKADQAGVIIVKSTITIFNGNGRERKFGAYGTVTPDNTKRRKDGKGPANPHLIEMAETRADKRAILKVTRCGYALSNEDETGNGEDNPIDDLREQARRKFFSLINEQGYSNREDRLKLCTQVLGREITTTKDFTCAAFNTMIKYMEGKTENKPEKEYDTKATPEQLAEIYELYKKLQYTPEKQKNLLNSISKKIGVTITSEEDFDYKQADVCIAYLKGKLPVAPVEPPSSGAGDYRLPDEYTGG